MKKVLLLGGSHSEIPLILAAQNRGYYVITTGNQPNGLGHKYSNKYINCDFSNKEKMLEIARSENVDAVCSGCNDFALLSAAYVTEKLDIPGHDSYDKSLIIHHKDKYRKFAKDNGIPTPVSYKCKNFEEVCDSAKKIGYPVIIKPVDLTGGKGIKKCENESELNFAYNDACLRTREDYIIVEKFIDGSNHGFSAFIQNQKVTFFFADNEQYYLNKYMVSGASTPADVSGDILEKLCNYSDLIANKLKLVDGILHIQYIVGEDGIPYIIEVCRRAPGDLYIKFVQMSTEINYPDMIFCAESGISLPVFNNKNPDSFFVRHCIMSDLCGVIDDIVFSEKIKDNIVDNIIWGKSGDFIADKFTYKAGIVFLKFETKKEMDNKLSNINDLIKIKVKEEL